jgi:hypothetical protein
MTLGWSQPSEPSEPNEKTPTKNPASDSSTLCQAGATAVLGYIHGYIGDSMYSYSLSKSLEYSSNVGSLGDEQSSALNFSAISCLVAVLDRKRIMSRMSCTDS